MKCFLFPFLLTATLALGQAPTEPNPNALYEQFAAAYDELNADHLANLYTLEAETLNLYDRSTPNSIKGRQGIKKYYVAFFQALKNNQQQLALTFKITSRSRAGDYLLDNGFYQLEIITPNGPSSFSFGKFSTVLERQDGAWKFKTDATTNADFLEYENANATTIPQREALLYAPYFDELLGTYQTLQNQIIVIGRSQVKLYAYEEGTQEYRGLTKVDANTWTKGSAVKSSEVLQTFRFRNDSIYLYENQKLISAAHKLHLYTEEQVTYKNTQGVKLAGTVFIPAQPNGKAMVMVHGSGPQDRNGYASIIRLLADVLAREGITVLTYDKQGVGQSEGNSDFESFTDLAEDAVAGIDYLKYRKDWNLSKIGLGGSSQAGWIIAKAIEHHHEKVDFALTIGAAGSGINVIDQNLYNTEVSMKCTGQYSEAQINQCLTQQRLFFDYLLDQKNGRRLDEYTRKIEKDTLLRDWLFPVSTQIDLKNRNQWFMALEIHFNPLPVWRNYQKPVLMLFSEYDDSTPARLVKTKVDQMTQKNIRTVLLENSQHIGLETDSLCKNDFAVLKRFHKDFFKEIKTWLKGI